MRICTDNIFSGLLKKGISAVIILLVISSCINPKNRTGKENLIPEKTFILILKDIYIANGLLTLYDVKNMFSARDSVVNFIDIIESYGYSYEAMNSTMNYYFISKPKKLIRIYDHIIRDLSEMESAIQMQLMMREELSARNALKTTLYTWPDTGMEESPGINRTVQAPGTYTVTFSVTLYPDDQSVNPRFTAWYSNADSSLNGGKIFLPEIEYIKDGRPHVIMYTGRIEATGKVTFRALFHTHDNNITELDKHARIELISFNFIVSPV